MFLHETIIISWRSIAANKLRSALTMLGIIIGTGSVIAMIAIGQGASASITENIRKMGSNLLFIRAGNRQMHGASLGSDSYNRLSNDDVTLLEKNSTHIRFVSPEIQRTSQVIWQSKNMNTTVKGGTPDWPEVNNYTVAQGRFFTAHENRARQRVAVIGSEVATQLFGENNPIGQTIRITRIPFEVIGIFAPKGSSGPMNLDTQVVIPFATAQTRVYGTGKIVSSINIQAIDEASIDQAVEEATIILRRSHKLKDEQTDDFTIRNQTEILQSMTDTSTTFTVLLASIAFVSLIVGGIGIMNIMLVSVIERTKEIGLRKAVGARNRDILVQFLTESVLLSISGGIIGVAFGCGLALIIGTVSPWKTQLTILPMIISSMFSLAVGVISGYYPARKAALMHPIDALRYE